ncbi:hypothetical protein PENCOP_c005G07187 [Penicillium coprophilum]|uniref:Large ribosomal subunit protein mL40 n=1 Tax=Penicillium coprophilum TaxID=36646 RepID=A0A1V6URG2_9EURO|nr:hypothetical protein PENCOP_c005G07187 [Penicillium coprophilum]
MSTSGSSKLQRPYFCDNVYLTKRAAKEADKILPSRNYSPWNSITSSPSHSLHPADNHHNEVLITSPRVARECLQDPHVDGAGPPINFPGVPRDPEPPNTTARPGHSSPAIRVILDDQRNGCEKEQQWPSLIRYFLHHPLTPRPLRFSRNRYLRHWTIHRAWQLFQAQQRRKQELEMMRQYQSMQDACEELRTGAGDGGKLFRVSMNKKGIFTDMFPIEYARMQTDSPPSDGWNHDWKKPGKK